MQRIWFIHIYHLNYFSVGITYIIYIRATKADIILCSFSGYDEIGDCHCHIRASKTAHHTGSSAPCLTCQIYSVLQCSAYLYWAYFDQILKVASEAPDTTKLSFGEMLTHCTAVSCPTNSLVLLKWSTSTTFMVPSSEAASSFFAPRSRDNLLMGCWPISIVPSSATMRMSHTLITPSASYNRNKQTEEKKVNIVI